MPYGPTQQQRASHYINAQSNYVASTSQQYQAPAHYQTPVQRPYYGQGLQQPTPNSNPARNLAADVAGIVNYQLGFAETPAAAAATGLTESPGNSINPSRPSVSTTFLQTPRSGSVLSPDSASTASSSRRGPRRTRAEMTGGDYLFRCDRPTANGPCNSGFLTQQDLS